MNGPHKKWKRPTHLIKSLYVSRYLMENAWGFQDDPIWALALKNKTTKTEFLLFGAFKPFSFSFAGILAKWRDCHVEQTRLFLVNRQFINNAVNWQNPGTTYSSATCCALISYSRRYTKRENRKWGPRGAENL